MICQPEISTAGLASARASLKPAGLSPPTWSIRLSLAHAISLDPVPTMVLCLTGGWSECLWSASTFSASFWTRGTQWNPRTQRHQQPRSPKEVSQLLLRESQPGNETVLSFIPTACSLVNTGMIQLVHSLLPWLSKWGRVTALAWRVLRLGPPEGLQLFSPMSS